MKALGLVLLIIAIGAFVAAAFLGATPAAARLTNVGLALATGAVALEVAPIP
jgi:hypothetical protein